MTRTLREYYNELRRGLNAAGLTEYSLEGSTPSEKKVAPTDVDELETGVDQ